MIAMAYDLINVFFSNVKETYGEEIQTYKFHSMRNLCDQAIDGTAHCTQGLEHNYLFCIVFSLKNVD